MFDTASVVPRPVNGPLLVHGVTAKGPRLTLREATPKDAEFVYSLRTDPELNRHLSPVPDGVEYQAEFIAEACYDANQLYFIIETDHPVGTVRLYDPEGDSIRWGSWILKDAPPKSAAESVSLVYSLAFDLGFSEIRYEVRKPNEKVWKYLETRGGVRTHEDELHYWYSARLSSRSTPTSQY
jgi:RimJ/RimL family protein N-acetyltransferase